MIEPENLKLTSGAPLIYATISLEKYDLNNIYAVVLTTENDVKIEGIFDSYIEDDLGDVIAVKYGFDKEEVLAGIVPVEDNEIVTLTVTGDIYSKWWEISFFGDDTIKIKS